MSSAAGSSISSGGTAAKFKIEQCVPSGSVKKGPYAVERSVDPNNVVIKRRFVLNDIGAPLYRSHALEDIFLNEYHDASLGFAQPSLQQSTLDFHQSTPLPTTHATGYLSTINMDRNAGEGSKPLFQREDIAVNREAAALVDADTPLVANNNLKLGDQRRPPTAQKRHSSTESSSPERYRERTVHKSTTHRNGGSTKHTSGTRHTSSPPRTSSTDASKHYALEINLKGKRERDLSYFLDERRERDPLGRNRDLSSPKRSLLHYSDERREKDGLRGGYGKASPKRRRRTQSKSISRSLSPPKKMNQVVVKRRSPEPIPYFTDEKREKDRLRRLYGTSVPQRRRSFSHSRSRTPPSTSARRVSRSPPRQYRRLHDRLRSLSGERRPLRTGALSVRSNQRRRSPRSRSNSPTREQRIRSQRRSRERERQGNSHRYGSNERARERGQHDNPLTQSNQRLLQPPQMQQPQPQIITIPVPVPEYTYAYGPWAPQPGWGARPPPHGVAYGMPPMMPAPYRLPPPYSMPPYNARQFRLQPRYGTDNYTPRARGGFRGRNT